MQIQDITIKELYGILIAAITISTTIGTVIGKWKQQKKQFKEDFLAPIKEENIEIRDEITKTREELILLIKNQDLNTCRNQLVMGFNDLKQAADLGQDVSDVFIQNLHELYTHYCELGGNSYVHSEFEKLQKEGLL